MIVSKKILTGHCDIVGDYTVDDGALAFNLWHMLLRNCSILSAQPSLHIVNIDRNTVLVLVPEVASLFMFIHRQPDRDISLESLRCVFCTVNTNRRC